jgi:hypothetical protein
VRRDAEDSSAKVSQEFCTIQKHGKKTLGSSDMSLWFKCYETRRNLGGSTLMEVGKKVLETAIRRIREGRATLR